MNHIVDMYPLTKSEGGLKLLHEADDDKSYGWNQQWPQHSWNENEPPAEYAISHVNENKIKHPVDCRPLVSFILLKAFTQLQ